MYSSRIPAPSGYAKDTNRVYYGDTLKRKRHASDSDFSPPASEFSRSGRRDRVVRSAIRERRANDMEWRAGAASEERRADAVHESRQAPAPGRQLDLAFRLARARLAQDARD